VGGVLLVVLNRIGLGLVRPLLAEAQTGQYQIVRVSKVGTSNNYQTKDMTLPINTPPSWQFQSMEPGPTNSQGRYSVNYDLRGSAVRRDSHGLHR
jgi:hypothetical protein